MGMDVYGIKPIPLGGMKDKAKACDEALTKLKEKIGPISEEGYQTNEWFENYRALDDEVKDAYKRLEDMVSEMNPGRYFRANIWSWRPIHMFCEIVIQHGALDIETKGWDENSGYGLESKEDCNILADAFEPIIESLEECFDNLSMDEKREKHVNDLRFYTNMMVIQNDFSNPFGICYEDGKFISATDWTPQVAESYKKFLNGRSLSHSLEATDFVINGKKIRSSYSVAYDHLKEFMHFLRHCGGFEIW